MLQDRIPEIQEAIAEESLDGWLFACFQHNDPVSLALLGLVGDHLVTRRCYYLIPRQGAPRKLVHQLESSMLAHLPGDESRYLTWQEHRKAFAELLTGVERVGAQYSPQNQLPTVSRLDAGTADLMRELGVEPISAADLISRFAATWSPRQLESHRRAGRILHEIVKDAFDWVGAELRDGREVQEYTVQQRILEAFERNDLHTESPPIVGVNAHSADPHYQPAADRTSAIRRDDFLLIDLWAKGKASDSVYADITWCGVCAAAPTDRQNEIFGIVRDARDAALGLVRDRFPRQEICGYEVDDAARAVIQAAGYGERFIHRTGHSIDTSDHGQGANMDNLETHDTRRLLPMTGFSIEPGIYLEGDFGVRSEINVALTNDEAEVSDTPQTELLRLLS